MLTFGPTASSDDIMINVVFDRCQNYESLMWNKLRLLASFPPFYI